MVAKASIREAEVIKRSALASSRTSITGRGSFRSSGIKSQALSVWKQTWLAETII